MAVDIQAILMTWQSAGVFNIILPALLFFAVIFGIMSATNIFGSNRAVHIIVALVVAIIAVISPDVQNFFQVALQNLGIALVIIIVVVLLTALFIPDEHKTGWAIGLYSLGGIAALFVVFNSFSEFSFFGSQWWHEWGAMIVGALFLVGVIIAISVSGGKDGKKPKEGFALTPWRG